MSISPQALGDNYHPLFTWTAASCTTKNFTKMNQFLTAILLLGILGGCNNSTPEKPAEITNPPAITTAPESNPVIPPATMVATLPSFTMVNAANQLIDLSQFRGKKVFINLWATWCPPCRAEIPSIESLAAKTDKNKVEFVLLSLDDDFEKAKSFANKNSMKLPVYYPAASLPKLFMVEGIPVTFIFSEKGALIYQKTGTANYDTKEFVDMINK